MQTIIKKIRLIYTPFLIIGISIIIFYSFLDWALIIKTNYFQIDEGIINIWIPGLLPIIPFLIWLPPKIKLLNLKTKKGGLPISYFFIAVFATSIPTIIAQEYLTTGTLTNMDNIEQINQKDPTKFYSLKNYYIDTANIGIYTSSKESSSGRFNENKYLEIEMFAVLPILVHEKDTLNRTCFAWYGLYDSDQIRLAESDYEKNAKVIKI
jgi:rhomboid protease GluP